jgi:hypothetical protein
VIPSYNTASSLAEKTTSGNFYNQNSFAKDVARIRHVSTTLLNKADSTNDFAIALSQPATVQNIVDPAAIVEPRVPVVEPVIPYYGAPIVEPLFPIVEPSVPLIEPIVPYIGAPLVDPLIPYDPRVINPLAPFPERAYPLNIPLIDTVLPNYRTPLGPVVEPVVPYQIPYYGVDPNLPAVEPVLPYNGSPYGPIFEPFPAYNFPGYYGLGTRF